MRAVFIDESQAKGHYYLGALLVDADALRHIERDLDSLVAMVAADVAGFPPDAEIHAYDVFHGKKEWSGVPVAWRVKVCEITARAISRSGASYFFRGVDVDALKLKYRRPHPSHELVLAQLLCDIDKELGTNGRLGHLGICHADDHHTAEDGRRNLRQFKIDRVPGYTDRRIDNLGDTLYFGPSHSSRLLQATDVATFFLNRVRHVSEKDSRARKSMNRIVDDVRSCTQREYVWVPSA